jgi:hypothetical protein
MLDTNTEVTLLLSYTTVASKPVPLPPISETPVYVPLVPPLGFAVILENKFIAADDELAGSRIDPT